MFGTAIRCIARKPKPPMKPIELNTPPEQTQTITRAIFDIVKEHGPLTISETWDHVKRVDEQEAHEDSAEVDEGEAEAQIDMQPCRSSEALSVHHLVYKAQQLQAEAKARN
ncbi:hypothetical protein C1H46_015019 [Malus baccata]|uniref:Uncharacterized protein n=1 Tax=Malus baccata TaxID=106549 RepID=A0A540MKP5_MALBA|nr:hypothetical protein C1H46_015019 [Malus baccata]